MGDLLVKLFVGFSLIIMGFDLWMVLPVDYKWVNHPGQVFLVLQMRSSSCWTA
jgi:hypothetical protein